ncbi:MAG: aldehyde dehydrogenase [Acidobacteria bacterium]|nr:aldehyde dehydrogenase [Acidobacteriota bacterium]
MTRYDATRLIVDLAGDAAIVASLGHPAYDLFAAGDRPRNFYTWGSMGVATSIGLGLALARPSARVIVLDGDGSLLMNLGSLATIGLLQPANLAVVVMDNEEYATTGGQPTPTAHGADLAAAARAMRIASAVTVRTEEELRAAMAGVARRLRAEGASASLAVARPDLERAEAGDFQPSVTAGPVVIVAKVDESSPIAKPPIDYVAMKERFMAALGTPHSALRNPQ